MEKIIKTRLASIDDLGLISELSVLMCSGDYCGEHDENFLKESLLNPQKALFLAFDGEKAVGFSHVYVLHELFTFLNDENEKGPFGCLDAIYVHPDYRMQGIAKKLVVMCENWSREMGCVEFTSGCDLDNQGSLDFHLGIGFKELHRIIHFSKEL